MIKINVNNDLLSSIVLVSFMDWFHGAEVSPLGSTNLMSKVLK